VNDIIADTEIFAQYTDYVNGCIEWMKGQATGNNVSEYALNLAKLAEHGTVTAISVISLRQKPH